MKIKFTQPTKDVTVGKEYHCSEKYDTGYLIWDDTDTTVWFDKRDDIIEVCNESTRLKS